MLMKRKQINNERLVPTGLSTSPTERPAWQSGFTLAESLVAAVVLLVAALATSIAITSGHMQMRDSIHTQRAVSLAEELAESILAMPYHDPDGSSNPGPESDEMGVSDFDNADDFHGYSEPTGQLTDTAGIPYADEYQVFSREVTAQYSTQTVTGLGAPITGLTVTVIVRDKKGHEWILTRFIAEGAALSSSE